MQYYRHQTTREVYGADERTRPPEAFFEERPTEFVKVAAPKSRKGGRSKEAAPKPEDGQGANGGDSEKGGGD